MPSVLRRSNRVVPDAYWSFHPLACVSALFGLWSWPLYPSTLPITHRWTTLVNMMYFLTMLFMVIWNAMSLSGWGTTNVLEVMFVLKLVFDMINALLLTSKWRQIRNILQESNQLGAVAGVEGNYYLRNFAWKVVILSVLESILVAALVVANYSHVYGWHVVIFAFQSDIVSNLLLGQLCFIFAAIGITFNWFNETVKSICSNYRNIFIPTVTFFRHAASADRFSNIGHIYFKLCKLTEETSALFGLNLCIIFALFVLNVVIGVFNVIYHWNSYGISWKLLICVCLIGNLSRGCLVTYYADSIQCQATASLDALLEVRLLDLNPASQAQVNSIIWKMSASPVQITAANFFPINRAVLISVAGGVTTYMIVLAQFRSTEEETQGSLRGINSTD